MKKARAARAAQCSFEISSFSCFHVKIGKSLCNSDSTRLFIQTRCQKATSNAI